MIPRRGLGVLAAVCVLSCGSSDEVGPEEPPPEEIPEIVQPGAPGEIGGLAGIGHRATDPVDADDDGAYDPPIAAKAAQFDSPMDVALGPDGRVYILDWNGHKIRAYDEGEVAFVVGTGVEGDACQGMDPGPEGCPAIAAQLNHPTDITFDAEGRLWIAAWHNSKIKRLDLEAGGLVNVCGDGTRRFVGDGGPCRDDAGADQVAFDLPTGVVMDAAENLLIADQANQTIRRLGSDGVIKTVAGMCPERPMLGFGCPAGRGYSGDGGPATLAKLNNSVGQGTDPQGKIALDPEGNLYIADTGNHVVRKVTPGADGILGEGPPEEEIITTIAGNGTAGYSGDGGSATEASLRAPSDVAVADDGTVYIADRANSCIRKVDPEGVMTTAAGQCGSPGLSGDGGRATEAKLNGPYGVALGDGVLYVADTLNHCVRQILVW